MDATGAEALRKRLAAHAHWRQAEAVREGRQSANDPDLLELEELCDGVRYYGREQTLRTVDGRSTLVTCRVRKTLRDGWWETSFVEESAALSPRPRSARR